MAKAVRPTLRRFFKTRLVDWIAAPAAAGWQPIGLPYPRLSEIDFVVAGLTGASGLYAIWHLGVRPQWLKLAATQDLGRAMIAARADPVIGGFQSNGGLYVAWLKEPPGIAVSHEVFLTSELRPLFRHRHEFDLAIPQQTPAFACPLPPGAVQLRSPTMR